MATNSMAISSGAETRSMTQGVVVLLGRFFFALIFLMAGANHFSKQTIGYAVSAGVPLASIAVPLSGVLSIAGGLSILLGYRAKLGGWLIVPGSGHLDDAQVLAGAGSHDGADPNDSVHEECRHARRGLAHFSVRSRTVQP
jgi:hypothetical protein